MNFSDNLKRIRKDQNLSQEELAEKLGVSRQAVSKWESGTAFPEMDKMITLCKMFDLNMDELINQNINEVNSDKQSKINVNKYIDDFLNYITKTVNLFSSMKFKQKVKCIFEQAILIVILSIIAVVLLELLSSFTHSILSFLPSDICYRVYGVFRDIYAFILCILVIIILLHTFKVRYLDYFKIVEEPEETEEEKEVIKKEEKFERDEPKIIIRDPKHSEYKFIRGLLNIIIFFLDIFASLIAFGFACAFIALVTALVLSCLFYKTGLMFIGIVLGLLACLLVTYILLNVLYNFIFKNKIHKKVLALTFLLAMVVGGISVGLCMVGVTEFDIIDRIENTDHSTTEETYKMTNDLCFYSFRVGISYIETNDKDVKVVIEKSNLYDGYIYESKDECFFVNTEMNVNVLEATRKVIKDINNKKLIDYSDLNIKIYSNKENINKLMENEEKYYDKLNQPYIDE